MPSRWRLVEQLDAQRVTSTTTIDERPESEKLHRLTGERKGNRDKSPQGRDVTRHMLVTKEGAE